MWCLGTWFSGGLGSVRFTVGLDDLIQVYGSQKLETVPKTSKAHGTVREHGKRTLQLH